MRPQGNPLDLNNLPEDYGKQPLEESSTTAAASTDTTRFEKKKGGDKDEGKVYECRFCSLKFCKSQALGGHMNRHRQERETETLNRAHQLVFGNEGPAGPGALGYRDLSMGPSQVGFQTQGNIRDPNCLQFRPVYPRPLHRPSQTNSTQSPTLHQPYNMYPPSSHTLPFPSSYPLTHLPISEYFVGNVLLSSPQRPPMSSQQNYGGVDSNYACFGASLSHGYPMARKGGPSNQGDGI